MKRSILITLCCLGLGFSVPAFAQDKQPQKPTTIVIFDENSSPTSYLVPIDVSQKKDSGYVIFDEDIKIKGFIIPTD